MQTHTTNYRFHLANLAPASGVALVRYNDADELVLCAGAVARLKKSDKVEHVFSLQPAALAVGELGVDVAPTVTELTGDNRYGRVRTRITDCPEYTAQIEELTPNGIWAALIFGRGKTRPQFEVTRLELDQRSWNAANLDEGSPTGSRFAFAASAVHCAQMLPTGFTFLKTLAFCIGGIDCDCFPPINMPPADILLEAQKRERAERTAREARFRGQRGRSGTQPGLTEMRKTLPPEQQALLDQLVQQHLEAKASKAKKG